MTKEQKEKVVKNLPYKYWLGKKRSLEDREKFRVSHLGKIPWNKGKKGLSGEDHPMWKGGISKTREYKNKYKAIYVARKKNAAGSHTHGEWETLKKQYNYTCPCCFKSEPEIVLEEDHIIPISKGGSNNIENIQPLCHPCNAKKHSKIIKFVLVSLEENSNQPIP